MCGLSASDQSSSCGVNHGMVLDGFLMVVPQWDRNHFNTVEDINISLALSLSSILNLALSEEFFKCYVQTYSYSVFSVFLGNMRECAIIFSFWFAQHSCWHAQSDIVTRFSACVFAINSKWKLKNLETLFMIFDPQLFHHLNRPGPLDQWVKIFSFLVSFSPRYSNFSESSPSIKLRGVKFRTVSYCAESINKICSESSAQYHSARSQFKVMGFSQVLLQSALN